MYCVVGASHVTSVNYKTNEGMLILALKSLMELKLLLLKT